MHDLDGVWLKVRRARKHMNEVKRMRKRFLESKPYSIREEFDPQSGDKLFVVDRVPKEPPLRLSAVTSDTIYNLRSALDQLAWQLVLKGGGVPGKDTAFPIWSDPHAWDSNWKRVTKGMCPQAIAIIKAEQPCFTGNEHWKRQFTWLEELSNVDKHRHLNITQAATGGGFWSYPLPMDLVSSTFIYQGPVNNSTVLARVPKTHADVKYYPAVNISFGQATGADGELVYPTLFRLGYLVQRTIRLFDGCFPASATLRLHRFGN